MFNMPLHHPDYGKNDCIDQAIFIRVYNKYVIYLAKESVKNPFVGWVVIYNDILENAK